MDSERKKEEKRKKEAFVDGSVIFLEGEERRVGVREESQETWGDSLEKRQRCVKFGSERSANYFLLCLNFFCISSYTITKNSTRL